MCVAPRPRTIIPLFVPEFNLPGPLFRSQFAGPQKSDRITAHMDTVFQALRQAQEAGEPVALCTVVKSEGSTPRHVGSRMLVYQDGHFIGTVGGGDLEHRVMDEAWMAMGDGQSRLLHYNMADPSRGDPGVC